MIIYNMDKTSLEELIPYLKQLLINQAISQHREICKTWSEGRAVETWCDVDESTETVSVFVRYESGNLWRYRKMEDGPEGMESEKILGSDKNENNLK